MMKKLIGVLLLWATPALAQFTFGGVRSGGGGGGATVTDTVRAVTFDSVRATRLIPVDSVRFNSTTSTIRGGAGNMTIQAGTGNNRALVFKITNTSGISLTSLTLDSARNVLPGSRVLNSSGTGGSPSYSFVNTPTTGMYMPFNGQDTLGFATGGVRTLSFQGAGSASILGGAGSMTIIAGTGASRTLTLRTTTSGSTAKNVLTLGADSSSTFLGNIVMNDGTFLRGSNATAGLWLSGGVIRLRNFNGTEALTFDGSTASFGVRAQLSGSGTQFRESGNQSAAVPGYSFANAIGAGMWGTGSGQADTVRFSTDSTQTLRLSGAANASIVGGDGNMTVQAGTGASRTLTLRTTTSGSVGKNVLVLGADSSSTFLGKIIMSDTLRSSGKVVLSNLTTEPSTQSDLCIDATTFQVYINAAATCTVSARRFKKNIRPLSLAAARNIVDSLRAYTFQYRTGGRWAIGGIAEQADSVNTMLTTRNANGQLNSINYEQVTMALLVVVQQQQKQIDDLKLTLSRQANAIGGLLRPTPGSGSGKIHNQR